MKFTKSATIYISDKHGQIVIFPKHENNAGIIFEQDKGYAAGFPIDNEELGQALIDNLNLYSVKDVNLRDYKKTDWPAFKQGKSKSVAAFEKEYVQISAHGANDSNLVLILSGRPLVPSELTVDSAVSFYADKSEIGQRVVEIYEVCLTGRIF